MSILVTLSFGGGRGEALCPKCKVSNVRFFSKVAKCADENCGLLIFRTKSEKQLTDKQIMDLLTNGKTGEIKGFKNQNGKTYNAAVKFDENFRVVFDFSQNPKKKTEK